ncbi:MAG: hypothetical protein GXX09_12615 [Syntrophomonadaceae bacterium]|nr:hypothetical protein [Syntrophomonadaceae bacterium]
MESEFDKKLERFIRRLLEGRVIPFLGAGISLEAKHEDGTAGLAQTSGLIDKLARAIYRSYKKGDSYQKKWGRWCCRTTFSRSTLTSLKNAPLDNLCEMYAWLKGNDGQQSLVREVLEIPKFEGLLPTPAHHYIAFLAREGLIDEIITTNYDTCMEKAYEQTFEHHNENPACVITDLISYRQKSGKTYVEDGQSRLRCLKIYKINGCATQAKDDPEKILLTERQLQDWGERQWARELFRERLRSRSLIFSGFGSDEPQVRHTVLQVVEEFGSKYADDGEHSSQQTDRQDNQSTTKCSCWDLPNAPFIAAFEPHLSFNQMQILHAYAKAHSDALEYDKLYQNVFCGKDTYLFNPVKSKVEELPANLFWKRVYQATFWKLLRRSCQPDSPAKAFLSPLTPAAEVLFHKMLDWLAPPDKPFGRFPELLTVSDDVTDKCNKPGLTPLSYWISCVRYSECNPPPGWYACLIDRPVLIPMLLLILYLTLGEARNAQKWDELSNHISTQKGFLFFMIPDEQNEQRTMVMIAHQERAFRNNQEVNLPAEVKDYSIVQVLIGNGTNMKARKIRIRSKDCNSKHVRFVGVYQVPLADIFRYTHRPHLSSKAYRSSLERETVLIADRARPRLRDRTNSLL